MARPPVQLQARLRVKHGADIAVGPGKVELLAIVARTGSLNEAAKQIGMSYMRAWTLLQTMNGCFREPLVETARGGKDGGSTRLTKTGARVLALYERMQRKALRAVDAEWEEIQTLLR